MASVQPNFFAMSSTCRRLGVRLTMFGRVSLELSRSFPPETVVGCEHTLTLVKLFTTSQSLSVRLTIHLSLPSLPNFPLNSGRLLLCMGAVKDRWLILHY